MKQQAIVNVQQSAADMKDLELKEFEDLDKDGEAKEKSAPSKGFAFSHPEEMQARLHHGMTTTHLTSPNIQDQKKDSMKKVGSDMKLPNLGSVKERKVNVVKDGPLGTNRPPDETTCWGRFLQQKLPRLQKPLTPKVTMIVLASVGLFFLIVGGLVLMGSRQAVYQMVQYDGEDTFYENQGYSVSRQECNLPTQRNQSFVTCNVTFTLDEDMSSPIYVHYGLATSCRCP